MMFHTLCLEMFQFTHPVRGATKNASATGELFEFQFTHPVRGATMRHVELKMRYNVSIHAPREGCD